MGVLDLPEYELTGEENIKVNKIISKYKEKRGALIPVLQNIQDTVGFLPLDIRGKLQPALVFLKRMSTGWLHFIHSLL